MTRPCTTVFLDVDDTIFDFTECSRLAMLQAAEQQGITLPDNIREIFTPINDGLWHRIEQGTLTKEGLWEIRWNLVFAAAGINGDGPAFEKQFIRNLYDTAVPVDGAEEVLKYLKGRYRVCIASNAFYSQQENRLTLAGFIQYTDRLFVSERIGTNKPQKGFFDGCFAELPGVTPEETVMIGDSVRADIRGAKDYGLQTIWFDKNRTGETPDCADHIVQDLREIRKIL